MAWSILISMWRIAGLCVVALALGASGCNADAVLPVGMVHDLSPGSDAPDLPVDGAVPGADLAPECPVPEEVAVANVDVMVHNGSGVPRFVAGGPSPAINCDVIGVTDEQGGAVAQQIGGQFACEGPGPPLGWIRRYHRVQPGETWKVGSWDGRRLVTCIHEVPCDPPWPGLPPAQLVYGSSHPAKAGLYNATVAVELTLRDACTTRDNLDWDCERSEWWISRPIQELCPSHETASATFMLPARGATSVTVELR